MPHDALHSASHTDGTDDIQSATSGQKGLMPQADKIKLDAINQGLATTDTPTFAGQALTAKQDLTGSTEQGAVDEEFDVAEYVGDANADHTLVKLLGILPVTQDYAEVWGGEDGTGQFGKGFIVKHNKASALWEIYYSSSGRWDGTEVLLFKLDSNGNQAVSGDLRLPKTSGKGVKVDLAAPTFPWRDITGYPSIRGNAGVDPQWNVYRGNIRQFQMDLTTKALTFCFHVPHDWVPGTDIHIHAHWSHILNNVTAGAITWKFETTYAKGFNQEQFVAPVSPTVTQNAPTGATGQYRHMIAEVQLTAASPSASQIDTDLVEVDGLFIVRINWTANTINPAANPFLHTVDLHYQSSNIGTKEKAPDFYV